MVVWHVSKTTSYQLLENKKKQAYTISSPYIFFYLFSNFAQHIDDNFFPRGLH